MNTIPRFFSTPALALGVMVSLAAMAEVSAQAETKPETPVPVPAPVPAEAKTDGGTVTETGTAKEAGAKPEGAVALTVKEEIMIADIKKHAELCSEAQLKMDFDKILPYVPKKLLELMGGHEVLKTRLQQGNAALKQRGVKIDGATIGKPERPLEHGGVIASLVPMTTRLTTPQGKLVATSHMIAVSEDKGESWVFVDTATVNEEKLGTLYPALKGKVKIPPATAKMAE